MPRGYSNKTGLSFFRKGDDNLAKQPKVRKKISLTVTKIMANPETRRKYKEATIKAMARPEIIKKMRKPRSEKGKRNMRGQRPSMSGDNNPSKRPEVKEKQRRWQINHPNRKFKNTSIELKVEEELKRRGIYYQKQIPLCNIAIVDFYLPEHRIVIECDGDYWHNRPKTKEKDEEKTNVLIFNGFNVYRFWQHEINESVKNCIDKLII